MKIQSWNCHPHFFLFFFLIKGPVLEISIVSSLYPIFFGVLAVAVCLIFFSARDKTRKSAFFFLFPSQWLFLILFRDCFRLVFCFCPFFFSYDINKYKSICVNVLSESRIFLKNKTRKKNGTAPRDAKMFSSAWENRHVIVNEPASN